MTKHISEICVLQNPGTCFINACFQLDDFLSNNLSSYCIRITSWEPCTTGFSSCVTRCVLCVLSNAQHPKVQGIKLLLKRTAKATSFFNIHILVEDCVSPILKVKGTFVGCFTCLVVLGGSGIDSSNLGVMGEIKVLDNYLLCSYFLLGFHSFMMALTVQSWLASHDYCIHPGT